MSNESGEIKVKALLSILLIDTLDFFNLGNTMNDRQIAQTVDLILEDYSVYKIDYFSLCFKRAKKGFYGKQYNRIDGEIIFEWLRLFDVEYTNEIEKERIKEKKRIERDTEKIELAPMPDNVKELMNGLGKTQEIKSIHIERTPEQIIVDGFIKDFDQLFKEQDDMSGGKRYVKIGERFYDMNEYLSMRMEEL